MKPIRTIERLAELTRLLYCRMAITSINPATGETLREYQELNAAAVEQKLATAARAFRTHRQSSFSERAAILQEAADLLEQEVATFARDDHARNGQANRRGAR